MICGTSVDDLNLIVHTRTTTASDSRVCLPARSRPARWRMNLMIIVIIGFDYSAPIARVPLSPRPSTDRMWGANTLASFFHPINFSKLFLSMPDCYYVAPRPLQVFLIISTRPLIHLFHFSMIIDVLRLVIDSLAGLHERQEHHYFSLHSLISYLTSIFRPIEPPSSFPTLLPNPILVSSLLESNHQIDGGRFN